MATKGKKKTDGTCCDAGGGFAASCCRVESLVSVDERGQMVLPKSFRDRAGIKAGDKLGLFAWEKGGEVCCIMLVKAEAMADMAKNMLSPLMKDAF